MRIALLTYSTRPRGGVVHTLALAEALAARGHDLTVWALSRCGDASFFRPVDPAVEVRLVPLPEIHGETLGPRVLRSVAALAAHVDPGAYDVVHAQDCLTANAVPGCLRTVHHLDTFTTPELVACHERAIREPYAHVCVSAAVATELRQAYGIEANVIPNGVDAVRFSGAAASGWEHLGRYVLAVGGIEPRKGSLDLLEAMALLQRDRPEVRLVIAGGETVLDHRDYRVAFDARAVTLGVAPVLLGPVAHDDLPSLVASAGAFAFPSNKEGFGLAAMEALAAGVPVVTRELPVLREVFGGAALFASDPQGFADRLVDALEAPDPALVAAGRALAGRHTWASAASAHERFYARVTST